jgi:hypothetical protein
MTRPQRPSLASTDDLTQAADIDINLALAQLIEQRYRSPIIRPSTVVDVAALIDESFPRGDETWSIKLPTRPSNTRAAIPTPASLAG